MVLCGHLIEYLNSEECKKKCDNMPVWYRMLFARIFCNETKARKSNCEDNEN